MVDELLKRNIIVEVYLSYTKIDKEVKYMIWGYTEIDEWFFTKQWNYYQRCEGNVVAYIEKMIGFYRVHVTERGDLGACDIEYRNEDFDDVFEFAEEYLVKYKNATKKDLWKDFYSPNNPEGYWVKIYPYRYSN